jgi:hypothetical protein
VIGLCTTAGIAMGYAINWLHPNGLGILSRELQANIASSGNVVAEGRPSPLRRLAEMAWLAIFVPGLVIGICGSMFQMDVDSWFGPLAEHEPVKWIGFIGARSRSRCSSPAGAPGATAASIRAPPWACPRCGT